LIGFSSVSCVCLFHIHVLVVLVFISFVLVLFEKDTSGRPRHRSDEVEARIPPRGLERSTICPAPPLPISGLQGDNPACVCCFLLDLKGTTAASCLFFLCCVVLRSCSLKRTTAASCLFVVFLVFVSSCFCFFLFLFASSCFLLFASSCFLLDFFCLFLFFLFE